MKQNIIDKAFKWLLAIGLLAPVLVSSKLFFPYITPKVVFFRWIVFVALIIFCWIFSQKEKIKYKISKVWWWFGGLTLAYMVCAVFGNFFEKSFWSNIERADGVVLMLYLFAYFVMLVYAFRDRQEIKWLLRASLAIALYICFYGIFQHLGWIEINSSTGARIASSFGNPAYLGNYALMHVFLAGYLFFSDQVKSWRWFYGLTALISGWAVFLTQTRGSILGLVGGIILACLVAIFVAKENAKIKKTAGIGVLLLILLIVGLYTARDSKLVQGSAAIRRATSISLNDYTTRTRLLAWQASFEGFKERPVFGWGPENYAYVFNQHFPAEIYRDAGSKIWFDKAHSIFFEYLTTMGVVGVVAYLGLIIVLIVTILKSTVLTPIEKGILVGLVAGYFFANMFVFDTLGTYLTFVLLILLVNNIANKGKEHECQWNGVYFSVAVVIVLFFFYLTYVTNIEGISYNRKLMQANQEWQTKGATESARSEYLATVDDNNNFTRFELRQHFANFVIKSAGAFDGADKKRFFERAIEEAERSVAEDPDQIRHYYNLINLYLEYSKYNSSVLDKAFALKDKLIELGPTRAHTYYHIAEIYLRQQKNEEALANFKIAAELNPKVADAQFNVLATAGLMDNIELVHEKEAIIEDLDSNYLQQEHILVKLVAVYQQTENLDELTKVFEKLLEAKPDNLKYYYNLALAYANQGRDKEARETIGLIQGISPNVDQEIEEFLENLDKGMFR